MPKVGGYRPGAGRPRKEGGLTRKSAVAEAKDLGRTPLQHLMAVMNDPDQPPERRDRAAGMLLPYCHPRISHHEVGKKELARQAAADLSNLGDWVDEFANGRLT